MHAGQNNACIARPCVAGAPSQPIAPKASSFSDVHRVGDVNSISVFGGLQKRLSEAQRQHAAARVAARAALERLDKEKISEDNAARTRLKAEMAAAAVLQAEVGEHSRCRCCQNPSIVAQHPLHSNAMHIQLVQR